MHAATYEIARALGVYMQNSAPYIENYVSVWCDEGFDLQTLKNIASYCFMHGRKSFEDMDDFVKQRNAEEEFIKAVLSLCGLTRRIIPSDSEFLSRWRAWGFSDDMIKRAAELSCGKNNPLAYMNGVLSSWKAAGTFTPDKIESVVRTPTAQGEKSIDRSVIERHYAELREIAENRAEQIHRRALDDKTYGDLHKKINALNIKLAFAEAKSEGNANEIEEQIADAEKLADERLAELGIDKEDFRPHYKCRICGDTGYDSQGKPCKCLKEFIAQYKNA